MIPHFSFGVNNSLDPYGGSVTCFAVVDKDLYIGTAEGGIFENQSFQFGSWNLLAAPGLTSGRIVALTSIGYQLIAATADSGLYILDHSGWHHTGSSFITDSVTSLTTSAGYILAGTHRGGVYMSADTGKTWKPANKGIVNTNISCLTVSGNYVVAGTTTGMYLSADNGKNWTDWGTGLGGVSIYSATIARGAIWAGTATGVFYTGILSVDWKPLGNLGERVNALLSYSDTLYAATPSGIQISTLASANWSNFSAGFRKDTSTALVMFNNTVIAGAKHDGIYIKNDKNWVLSNTGFNNLKVHAVCAYGSLLACATNNGLFVAKNDSFNFVATNNGLPDSLHITAVAFTGKILFVGTANRGMFLSNDTGKTWVPSNNSLGSLSIAKIVLTGSKIYVATAEGSVFSSQITYLLWSKVSSGLPTGPNIVSDFIADADTVYMAYRSAGVYICRDGKNWNSFGAGLPAGNISSLCVNHGSVYAASENQGIYICSAPSASWASTNLFAGPASAVGSAPVPDGVITWFEHRIFVSNYGGFFRWSVAPLDLPTFSNPFAFAFGSHFTFIATPYNSLYMKNTQYLFLGIDAKRAIEPDFEIYPNPAGGNITIDFVPQENKTATAALFDMTGKCVTRFNPTPRQMIALDYPKGIYLLQLHVGNDVAVKRVVIE